MATPLDILYHYAARNISPKHTLDIARVALTHKSGHSEPIVHLAKNIVHCLETEAFASVIRSPYPQIPPYVDVPKLLNILPMIDEWKVKIPQDVLDLALHDVILEQACPSNLATLIRAGADVNAIHPVRYFPPLIVAARKGNEAHVRMLLLAGADPNCNVDGHTAVSHATLAGHDSIVDVLLEYGAVYPLEVSEVS